MVLHYNNILQEDIQHFGVYKENHEQTKIKFKKIKNIEKKNSKKVYTKNF